MFTKKVDLNSVVIYCEVWKSRVDEESESSKVIGEQICHSLYNFGHVLIDSYNPTCCRGKLLFLCASSVPFVIA